MLKSALIKFDLLVCFNKLRNDERIILLCYTLNVNTRLLIRGEFVLHVPFQLHLTIISVRINSYCHLLDIIADDKMVLDNIFHVLTTYLVSHQL